MARMHDEYPGYHIVYSFHEGQCQPCNVVILSVDASAPADDGSYRYGVTFDRQLKVVWIEEKVADQKCRFSRLEITIVSNCLAVECFILSCLMSISFTP